MKVARSVAEILSQHTTLTLECIDRMYLNVYVPLLQAGAGVAYFFRKLRGRPVPSSALMAPMTERFVSAIKRYAEHNRIDVVTFRSPARSATMPAFSWKMPSSGIGRRSASHGTATFTSRWPRATIYASSSSASAAPGSGGASGSSARWRSTRSRNAAPRSMASISAGGRVQPTTRRM